MVFDTDIIIWLQRGNPKAAKLIESNEDKFISSLTYMELLQCAQSKSQHVIIRDFLCTYNVITFPINQSISHRASIYIEEYSLSHGLRTGDAIIAATAVEHAMTLASGNKKHFSCIKELQLKIFKP